MFFSRNMKLFLKFLLSTHKKIGSPFPPRDSFHVVWVELPPWAHCQSTGAGAQLRPHQLDNLTYLATAIGQGWLHDCAGPIRMLPGTFLLPISEKAGLFLSRLSGTGCWKLFWRLMKACVRNWNTGRAVVISIGLLDPTMPEA